MPKSKSGGRLRTSRVEPQPFSQRDSAETEVKYYGLVRDNALGDLASKDRALAEVLTDIQDSAEASVLGRFVPNDLQVLDGVVRYDLKREDFEILKGASINAEDESGRTVPLVNPRQRISDRIAQAERFAGRGTNYQGQGTVLYKYYVPETQPTDSVSKYSHTNPPPFFTEAITSTAENSADFIPSTVTQISNTHRIGYIQNGRFVPDSESEYWWSGEYDHYMNSASEYGDPTQSALTNPKFPIVRDGNMKFDQIAPRGISTRYNWGLRFDAWFKRGDFASTSTMMRWAAQVNGHLRIDYFDKTGYNPTTRAIEGTWRTALNTADSTTYYTQVSRENSVPNVLGGRLYYVQGGPTMPLGTGSGSVPSQRSLANGGALDLAKTYTGLEGSAIKNFLDDYVPVVIRFWYGQPSTDPAQTDIVTRRPLGTPSFFIQMLDTNLSTADISKWNDYSAQLRLTWNSAQSAWSVDTSSGGSAAEEANFANYSTNFEVIAYTTLGASKPAVLTGYTIPSTTIIGTKGAPVSGVTYASFSVPGVSPTNGQTIWAVVKNRPFNVVPGTATLNIVSMWQKYLFNPNPTGKYGSISDLLENVGKNYVEPDPSKIAFEANLDLYRATLGGLPKPSTYTSTRYDGTLTNSVTSSNTERDYDYNHSKLLMIGRQKKGTVAEIGTTSPYAGKNLATGETRKKGENYTFIEVVENAAGFGGTVTINAYPSNDLGVISTTSTTTYGKALHMLDNTTTFSKSSRQNISTIALNKLPSDANFASTSRVLYEEVDGVGRLSVGTWNGSAFTYDNTGIIAQLTMGATGSRNHVAKSMFIAEFTKGTTPYSFYGLIGAQRTSFSGVTLTVNSGEVTITSSGGVFTPDSTNSNNNQYIGSEIIFPNDATVRRVTSYNASTGTVTFTPSIAAGQYTSCQVYYNHLQLGSTLPANIVSSTGAKVVRTTVIPVPSGGNISDRLVQIRFVFNSAYQFLRADSGSSLSFGETLYVKAGSSPTEIQPFSSDTELPAPPADIVVPFGYDNTSGASDPGLGGLCYPPYSIQNISLQAITKTDTALYASTEGQFDIWWGGRVNSSDDMGQKYLYVTDKLMFDFSSSERSNLLSSLLTAQKPVFGGSEYTHKLEVELNVGLPDGPVQNANLYKDVRFYSNNKPVKDRYYLFIRKQTGGSQLSVLSANNPSWT